MGDGALGIDSGVFSGGLIFVAAALLWSVVLVPAWVRRHRFTASERHALRLQRTIRVLAEAAELPDEVRAEATAREALAQERLLRTARRAQAAARKAERVELRRPQRRRLRSIFAGVLLVSVAASLAGGWALIAGYGSQLLVVGLSAGGGAFSVLLLLAPSSAPLQRQREDTVAAPIPARAAPTLPQPVERAHVNAMKNDRAVSAHAAAQAAAAAQLDRAKAMARARTHTSAAPSSDSIAATAAAAGPVPSPPGTAAAAADRLQQMGVVGDTREGMLDLDRALRARRRAS